MNMFSLLKRNINPEIIEDSRSLNSSLNDSIKLDNNSEIQIKKTNENKLTPLINETEEKTLNRYLKINQLIKDKKIQQNQLTKEENVITTGNIKKPIQFIESDEEESLVNLIKEIDKKKIITNNSFFINGEIINYKASNERQKKKKTNLFLQDMRLKLKQNEIFQIDQNLDEDHFNNFNKEDFIMDLDEHIKNMQKENVKLEVENNKCFIF